MPFDASWTVSHAIDYIPDAIFDVPYASDQNNIAADRGNSLQDQRHRVLFSGVFMTPAASLGGLWRILGDINFAPIVTDGTPVFYNITTGGDTNGDGVINLMNTTNFNGYNAVWGNGAYRSTPNATVDRATAADDPRVAQFGLRFTY